MKDDLCAINERILNDPTISPLNKVYNIARNLRNRSNKLVPSFLWYAILELKDQNIKDIIVLEESNNDK